MIKLDRSYDIQPSPDSPLETDLVTKMFHNFRVDIVEKQDALIMDAIHHIGGDQYQHITIDKSKVIDALGKSVPKKPTIKESFVEGKGRIVTCRCPSCHYTIVLIYKDDLINTYGPDVNIFESFDEHTRYCSKCGQALDWDLEKEKEDEKEI